MRGSKQLAMMFLLGAVLVGGVLGFTADRVVFRDQVCAKELTPQGARDQFAKDLSLTPAQRIVIDSILDMRHQQIAAVMKPVRPQIEAIKDSTRAQMTRALDVRQREKFEAMRQEMRRRKNTTEKQ
jgi:hypothetical protein